MSKQNKSIDSWHSGSVDSKQEGNDSNGQPVKKEQSNEKNIEIRRVANQILQRRMSGSLSDQSQMRQQVQSEAKIFDDDEPIIKIEVKKETSMTQQQVPKVQLSIKALTSKIKPNQISDILPAMISVKATGGKRSSADIICVLDVSSSMSGQKIHLLKETLLFLLNYLSPSDRLSLITFNQKGKRICGLKCVTPQNLDHLNLLIGQIQAGGSTNVNGGLQLALKTIRDKKFQNQVTTVFLLTDGNDNSKYKDAAPYFIKTLEEPQNKELGLFTIHSFGYGNDHDEKMMMDICKAKNGAFYYMKDRNFLDEAFCSAFGGIISVVASEVKISLKSISNSEDCKVFRNTQIFKTYNRKWQYIKQNQYELKIVQMNSGSSKNLVFQLQLPPIKDIQVDADHLKQSVLQVRMQAFDLNGDKMQDELIKYYLQYVPQKLLKQTEIKHNPEVQENLYRVKAVEVIQINTKLAQDGQNEKARQGIRVMKQMISDDKIIRQQKLKRLVQDLELLFNTFKEEEYQTQGRRWGGCCGKRYSSQQNDDNFRNDVQLGLIAERAKFRIENQKEDQNTEK